MRWPLKPHLHQLLLICFTGQRLSVRNHPITQNCHFWFISCQMWEDSSWCTLPAHVTNLYNVSRGKKTNKKFLSTSGIDRALNSRDQLKGYPALSTVTKIPLAESSTVPDIDSKYSNVRILIFVPYKVYCISYNIYFCGRTQKAKVRHHSDLQAIKSMCKQVSISCVC